MALFSKLSGWFELFLFIILIVKLMFLYSMIRLRIAKKHGGDKKTVEKFENLEELTHNLFFTLMSILIIYLFRPHALYPLPVVVDGETKTFLFIFGVLILMGILFPKV